VQPNKPNSVFPLRLPTTTRIQASELASRDGISLNQFISLAVAEKIVRLQSTDAEPFSADPEVDQTGAVK
jgi:hypothetical protein